MPTKQSTTDFIACARQVHGQRFSYEKAEYQGTHEAVIVTCAEHGDFSQKAHRHLSGQGCPRCGYRRTSAALRSTRGAFIGKARAVHGDRYEYDQVEYAGNKTPVRIGCRTHGIFAQRPDRHLTGQGCPPCGRLRVADKERKVATRFIEQANEVHKSRYTYGETVYSGAHKKIVITCSKHGSFRQKAHDHLNGSGCPKCGLSKGELRVSRILSTLGVEFREQYRDSRCRNMKPLPFDFAVLRDGKVLGLIEYQGVQHYQTWRTDKKNPKNGLEARQRRDRLKAEFCQQYEIPLLTIPYWESGRAEDLIATFVRRIMS